MKDNYKLSNLSKIKNNMRKPTPTNFIVSTRIFIQRDNNLSVKNYNNWQNTHNFTKISNSNLNITPQNKEKSPLLYKPKKLTTPRALIKRFKNRVKKLKKLGKKSLRLRIISKKWTLKKYRIKKHIENTDVNQNKYIFFEHDNFNNLRLRGYFIKKKTLKKKYKQWRYIEKRRLNRFTNFFKFFGFRYNKNRAARRFKRVKKFKKFLLYKKILNIFAHNKDFMEESRNPYLLQGIRTHLSYYKMRWQFVTYLLDNYFSPNMKKENISKFRIKAQHVKKNKIINFISNVEFTLSAVLLQMRLVATRGIANQLIKHGNVYVNYKKIEYPLFKTKVGDTISILVNPSKSFLHRFTDPIYSSRWWPGLYRRNTGRQSLTVLNLTNFSIKNSLSIIGAKTKNKQLGFVAKQILHYIFKNGILVPVYYKKQKKTIDNKFAAWKHSFIVTPVTNIFLKQKYNIDKVFNNLI